MTNILFVDDDRVTLKLVKEILEGTGYSCVAVSDPRDALEYLEKETFDLIITDANMPGGISGFDFIKTLRKKEKFAKIPVAMLTGRRDKKDIQLGLSSGADDYIIKPIDPLILVGKVESLLKKRSAEVPTTRFPEGPVRQPAEWVLNLQISYISERGLSFVSPLPAPPDAKIKIKSDFFVQIEIESPMLRVTGYSRDPQNPSNYIVNCNFIGLTDQELQKIRGWLNTKFSDGKQKAG